MLARSRRTAFPLVLLLLLAGLVACGDKDEDKENVSAPAHASVKSSEIPDIVADYVPEEPHKVKGADGTGFEVAASLLYGNDPAVGVLTVALGADQRADQYRCRVLLSAGVVDGCEEIDTPGGQVVLTWVRTKPEDPGSGDVTVVLQRDRELVVIGCKEDGITGDPREQDLFIPVDAMIDIARDERLTLG